MTTILFLITFTLILLSRLKLTFWDEPLETGSLLKMAAIPLVSLFFIELGPGWYLLFAYLLIYPGIMYLLEKKSAKLYRNRIIMLLIHATSLGVIFFGVDGIMANADFAGFINATNASISDQLLWVLLVLFGILLVMNEMNIVLRYLMNTLNLAPIGEKMDSISDQQYNTGRVIGMLERIFIFIFTLAGQLAAIGFILTAKGVVRYPEFKDRTFAEYVLIGTLLSALLAMGVAFLLRAFV